MALKNPININNTEENVKKILDKPTTEGTTGTYVGDVEKKVTELEADVNSLPIKSLEGQTVKPTISTTATAGTGATIIGDINGRTFQTSNGSPARGNVASGRYSIAMGRITSASGDYSTAMGYGTIAKGDSQTALGKYNVTDDNDKYGFIVGNGTTASQRSNAFTVDWDGNVEASGDVTDGSGNVLAEKANVEDVYKEVDLAGFFVFDRDESDSNILFVCDVDNLTSDGSIYNSSVFNTKVSSLADGAYYRVFTSSSSFPPTDIACIMNIVKKGSNIYAQILDGSFDNSIGYSFDYSVYYKTGTNEWKKFSEDFTQSEQVAQLSEIAFDFARSDIADLQEKTIWEEKTISDSVLIALNEGENILSSFNFVQMFSRFKDGFYHLTFNLSNPDGWSYKHTHLFIKTGSIGYLQTVDDEELGLNTIYRGVYVQNGGYYNFTKMNVTPEETKSEINDTLDKSGCVHHFNSITDLIELDSKYGDCGGFIKDGKSLKMGDTIDCDFVGTSENRIDEMTVMLEDMSKAELATEDGHLDTEKVYGYGVFKSGKYKNHLYTTYYKKAFKKSTLDILIPLTNVDYLSDNIEIKLNDNQIVAVTVDSDAERIIFVGLYYSGDGNEFTAFKSGTLYDMAPLDLSIALKIKKPKNGTQHTFKLTHKGFEKDTLDDNYITNQAAETALSQIANKCNITYNYYETSSPIELERNCLYLIRCNKNVIVSDASGSAKVNPDGSSMKAFKNGFIMTVSNCLNGESYQDLLLKPTTLSVEILNFFTNVKNPDSYVAVEDASEAGNIQIWKCKIGG